MSREDLIAKTISAMMHDILDIPFTRFHCATDAVMNALKDIGFNDAEVAEMIQIHLDRVSAELGKCKKHIEEIGEDAAREEVLSAAKIVKDIAPSEYQDLCKELGKGDIIDYIESTKGKDEDEQ